MVVGSSRRGGSPEGSWGPQSSKFSHFCNPYGVICTFSRAQHGPGPRDVFWQNRLFSGVKSAEGALRRVKIVQNGQLERLGVSVGRLGGSREVLRGAWGPEWSTTMVRPVDNGPEWSTVHV